MMADAKPAAASSPAAKSSAWRPKKLVTEPKHKKHKASELEGMDGVVDEAADADKGKTKGASASSRPFKPGGKQNEQNEAAAGVGKAATRRGGRRNRRKQHDEKVTVKDAGLKMFLVALAKLSLQTAYRVRLVWGGVLDVAIGPENHPIARAIAAEGEMFSESVEAIHAELAETRKKKEDPDAILERLRNQPAPAKSNYMGLIEALISTPEAGGKNIAILKKWADDLGDSPPAVQTCKLASVRQSGHVMVILGQRDVPIRSIVNDAIEQCGFRVKVDVPPPSGLEDDVSAWLAQLDK